MPDKHRLYLGRLAATAVDFVEMPLSHAHDLAEPFLRETQPKADSAKLGAGHCITAFLSRLLVDFSGPLQLRAF